MKWFKLDTSVIEALARSIPCTTSVRRSSGTFQAHSSEEEIDGGTG